jgi:hypothetical protein
MIGMAMQLGASLFAIFAIFALAAHWRLGHDVRLAGEAEARELAEAAVCGFAPVDVVLDRAGIAALLRDAGGRVMLIRRHGARFAARLLDGHRDSRLDRNFLTIATGERIFGEVTLDLGKAAGIWAASLRRLGQD